MKAILILLVFCIVFLAMFANSNYSINGNYESKLISKIDIPSVEEQSFFSLDPSSQIRNQIEICQDSIIIPEPIH